MPITNCISCNTLIHEGSIFCHSCGSRLKCKACKADLQKDASFCHECGESTKVKPIDKGHAKNTVVYHRKSDEIYCEASLNDDVAKTGLSSLFDNLANSKQIKYQKLEDTSNPILEDVEEVDEEEAVDTNSQKTEEAKPQKESAQTDSLPHLSDIEMTLNCSEGEWILIYALYESDFATKTFTKKAVYDKYMSKRKTDARIKNFTMYWRRSFKYYFSTVNESEIKFKLEKITDLKELIQGQKKSNARTSTRSNSQSKSKNQSSSKAATSKKNSSSLSSYTLVTELNLNPKGEKSLKDFYSEHKTDSNPEVLLIIVYYLERILKDKSINEDKIYSCLKNLHLPVPNLRQTLNNIHSRKGWINTSSFGDLKVTTTGENFLEHEISKTNK